MEGFLKKFLQYIHETNLFLGESFRRMFGFGKFEKYGNKDNKSNQQVALIRVLFILLAISFVIIVLRLSYIVTFKGEEYKRMVYSQRQTSDIVIPCERGSIYDAKGTVLASNIKKYIVILDAKQVMDYSKQMGNSAYIEATAEALNQYLGFDKQQIVDFIYNNPKDAYERISKDENGKVIALDAEEVKPLMEAITASKSKGSTVKPIYGIQFEDSYSRIYPNNSLACDLLGYVNDGGVGMYGLEQYYEEELKGVDGRSFGYINDYTNLERQIVPAKNGNSLVLNIDASIQRIVERKIIEVNESMDYSERSGSYNTGVIIMECDTGNVLAMAGWPFYDLNNPREVTIDKYYSTKQINELMSKFAIQEGWVNGISSNIFIEEDKPPYFKILNEETGKDDVVMLTQEQLDKLDDDLSGYVRDGVWKNFCISDTYEPGSVAKTITTAIGLDSGKLVPSDSFHCTGLIEVLDRTIHCSHRWGCGGGDLRMCLVKSCNPAYTQFGKKIGKETFLEYSKDFYGVKTGIDLTGEVSAEGLVFTEKTLNTTELATASFGQGFNATMIQMICGFNSLINGGQYYEPHVVNRIVDENGCIVKNIEPRILKQTVSESTSDKLKDYCIGVVEESEGTGKKSRPAGYRIGGKTGTAQISGVGGYQAGQYVVSFMSFAPADDPQLVMYVVIDRPNIPDQSSGAVNQACELTREIYTEVLPYLNIPMTEPLTEKEYEELLEKGIYTSNIVIEENVPEDNTDIADEMTGEIIEPAN
ncbi:stage V sporulation protein D (sporulation-specific penicillin-binding protein) [Lachnospiraceae bacterium G41]|nr:stage V sporulation protein D (sporulation-specific penicillin-binding protein) [Lachnospiraceae bacterium G41]